MKKIKTILCVVLLSLGFASNIFAIGTFESVFANFFGDIVKAVVSNFTDSDDCPIKLCQDCKPSDPSCRPGGN